MTTYTIEITDAEGVERESIRMEGVRTDHGAMRRMRTFAAAVLAYESL